MTSPIQSPVRKEEQIREKKKTWIDQQTRKNEAGKLSHAHERADFLDETKADLEPRLRKAVPSGEHISTYGKRIFVGFPGFGRGKIAARRKPSVCISSSPSAI